MKTSIQMASHLNAILIHCNPVLWISTASKDTRMFIPIVLNNAEGHSPLDFKCHIATHSLYIVHDSILFIQSVFV